MSGVCVELRKRPPPQRGERKNGPKAAPLRHDRMHHPLRRSPKLSHFRILRGSLIPLRVTKPEHPGTRSTAGFGASLRGDNIRKGSDACVTLQVNANAARPKCADLLARGEIIFAKTLAARRHPEPCRCVGPSFRVCPNVPANRVNVIPFLDAVCRSVRNGGGPDVSMRSRPVA